ncbi:ABC transporter [Kwoniella mangroviensis CBS 10435]|uniref:ABC transporter n=1 Tax=Kwoniella mangroviensis CBS 10435 TaxID=1331196 RepID=A0A1B9IWY6_9TREE|nr:ABC transporter [Kwoniella mangroviensis CBS 10435]
MSNIPILGPPIDATHHATQGNKLSEEENENNVNNEDANAEQSEPHVSPNQSTPASEITENDNATLTTTGSQRRQSDQSKDIAVDERDRDGERDSESTVSVPEDAKTGSNGNAKRLDSSSSNEDDERNHGDSQRREVAEDGDDGDEWSYGSQLKADQKLLESRGLAAHHSLALAYDHLSVRGQGGADDVTYAPTVGGIIAPWTNRRYKKKAAKLAKARVEAEEKGGSDDAGAGESGRGEDMRWKEGDPIPKKGEEGLRKGERYLLKDFNGLVKPGEMMLVVGRPGSGCTTFLKALAGLHNGYAGIDGTIYYGDMSGDKALNPYKADVIFNSEEDIHDPNLLVGRTLDFALRMNTPSPHARLPEEDGGQPMSSEMYQDKTKGELLKIFGLEHTHDTKVGDQYVRGVSGGEKKRVSIAEVLTTKASVQLWDNATRGLDADTALKFNKVIRTLTDIERNTSVVSLYQAGNGIYNLFNKVTVIAEGRVIYYGPREEARKYFEDLGFVHPDGGNTADFLTSVTATNERVIKEGHNGKAPTSPAEFSKMYEKSDIAKKMRQELDEHLKNDQKSQETRDTQDALQKEKHRLAPKKRSEKVDYFTQVRAALIRDYQMRWGDQWTLWARQATTLIQALLVGSLFYSVSDTTGGLLLRGGAIFLTLLYPSLISLSETTAAFSGRAVLAKHKAFSLYRPSAVLVAQTIGDLPIFLGQLIIFTLIIYFMVGLKVDPGLYFIFLLFTYITTLCTTAFFRFIGYSFGTFNNASKVSGLMFSILVTYAGYIIYTPSMKPWFSWIRWIDPVYYSFEALMSNELAGEQLQCIQPQLVPYGQNYMGTPAGCAIAGAQPGSTTLDGQAWLNTALDMYKSHVWRNFGIVVALWIFFLGLAMITIERLPAAGSNKAILLYKRGGGGKFIRASNQNGNAPRDEEQGNSEMQTNEKPGKKGDKDKPEGVADEGMTFGNSTFTWKNLTYKVHNHGKDLTLLDDVFGYCKAGTLTALMGSSGAGKTTLMDVLAARKTEGEIHGEVLMNGQALPVSFQRTTGYCEQVDVHLPQATVREALEFSALLRQPRSLSDKEKLAYVDVIIDLLELHDIEDAMIGTPGAGLGVEQRKRLTIGVELVSKPSLLFLDEPTSGLDGQSSFLIVSFLRKLAAAGQAVLCTIHQPSASLFAQFDLLLLLKAGGKMVYFGEVDNLSDYFSKHDIKIPKEVNPAERMIDIVSGDLSKGKDWAKIWSESEECKARMKDLEDLKKDTSGKREHPEEDDKYEYASTTGTQLKLVTKRASIQLWRDTEYVTNKVALHIGSALFNGFSFWMIGNKYADLQNRIFTIFQFIFVAPGVIAQTQPKFIANRDIFEAREKKAKLYSWQAFCFGEIVAEIPYLLVCALLYFAPWYPVVGFSFKPSVAGPVYLQMTLYEFLYTGIGQFVAAYAPNAVFAALVNPLLIGVLVSFCGVLVPYPQITAFWRYWIYYLNPFNYLIGGLVSRIMWDVGVQCAEQEFGLFDPPSGQTCSAYMQDFLSQNPGYIDNPDSTSQCRYCPYSKGNEYLQSLNLGDKVDGWRDIAITALFVLSSYGFVFLLLKLRSKASKKAS